MFSDELDEIIRKYSPGKHKAFLANLEKDIQENEEFLSKKGEENAASELEEFKKKVEQYKLDPSRPPRYTHQGWTYFEPTTKTYIGQTHASPDSWYGMSKDFLNDFYGKDVFLKEKPDYDEFTKIMSEQNVPSDKAPIRRGEFWRYFNPIKNKYVEELVEPEKYYNAPQDYIDRFFGRKQPAAADVRVSNENVAPSAAAAQPSNQPQKSSFDILREVTKAIRYQKSLEGQQQRGPISAVGLIGGVPAGQQSSQLNMQLGMQQNAPRVANTFYNAPEQDINPALLSQMAILSAQRNSSHGGHGGGSGRQKERVYNKIMKYFNPELYSPEDYVEDVYGV